MNLKHLIQSWLKRISLTVKMVIITLVVGIVVWVVLDIIQTYQVKKLFLSQLEERLAGEAEKNRIKFDFYKKSYHQTVRLFVRLNNFTDYIKRQKWSDRDTVQVRYYTLSPPWFPPHSILRFQAPLRYALLLDQWGKAREVYHSGRETPPKSILQPTPIMLAKSSDDSYMAYIEDIPFLFASETLFDTRGKPQAILMLATPIDEEFLKDIIGASPVHAVALLTPGENPRILISSDSKKLPPKTPLEIVKKKYHIIGVEFFDYGTTAIMIKLASFIPLEEVNLLAEKVVLKGRQDRGIVAIAFLLSFALIMAWITSHIQSLTRRITDVSEHILGVKAEEIQKGDQLYVLENRFQRLTEEIVEAREVLKRQAEEKTRLIVENAFDAIITTNAEGEIMTLNPQAEAIFGWSLKEIIGRRITDTILPLRYLEEQFKGFGYFFRKGEGLIFHRQIETIASHRDAGKFLVELSISPASERDSLIFIFIIRDITERKKAEEEIRRSLEEKEVLLREIHHRVKNNMQVISSMLRLQSDKAEAIKDIELLKESQNRIKSMALIHEKLYKSRDLTHIDFNDYISDLVKGLFRTYGSSTDRVAIKIDGEDIQLGIDSAIPCGLIVNELVSNTLKYAFPDSRNGEIKIALHKINEDEIELLVKDTGVGIPKEVDFRATETLGLRLVTTLVENQLQGKVELHRNGGTEFHIRFKI